MENIDISILNKAEIEKSHEAFIAFDKDQRGYIDAKALKSVLEEMGQRPNDDEVTKMINEVDSTSTGKIFFNDFLRVIAYHKVCMRDSDDSDTLDAFVAMGGNADGSGKIDASKLIDIVKMEFGMTIDIKKLIEEIDIDGSGEIEYNEFKALLSNY